MKEIEELKNLKELIMKKGIEQHFEKEDSYFINACMRHGGDCNGCKFEKMCNELNNATNNTNNTKNDKYVYRKK